MFKVDYINILDKLLFLKKLKKPVKEIEMINLKKSTKFDQK
jgi:hypothetical protein